MQGVQEKEQQEKRRQASCLTRAFCCESERTALRTGRFDEAQLSRHYQSHQSALHRKKSDVLTLLKTFESGGDGVYVAGS